MVRALSSVSCKPVWRPGARWFVQLVSRTDVARSFQPSSPWQRTMQLSPPTSWEGRDPLLQGGKQGAHCQLEGPPGTHVHPRRGVAAGPGLRHQHQNQDWKPDLCLLVICAPLEARDPRLFEGQAPCAAVFPSPSTPFCSSRLGPLNVDCLFRT